MADEQQRQSLMMGIAMHHIPVAFVLMSMLMQSGVSKTISVFSLVVFMAMSRWVLSLVFIWVIL